ncbi:hypothetical protein ACO0SA_004357 [Hanseniaspora valbyensis]
MAILEKLRYISKKIDGVVETRGIERVPPEAREVQSYKELLNLYIQVVGFWISAAGGLSSMSSFLLGPLVFGLDFIDTIVIGLVGMWVGCFIAAYCAIMGPQSGCRQMVTARYLFGVYLVKFIAFVSICGVLGWSVVNSVVGGEILYCISGEKLPLWVGILIICAVSYIVATLGIKQVLKVEMYLCIPVTLVFLLMYIATGSNYRDLLYTYKNPSENLLGAKLSFFSLCYSITSTWGSITSDYYILFPETTKKRTVFMITLVCILVPTTFVGVLGTMLASVAMSNESWMESYDKFGMGGLLYSSFDKWNVGFAKFLVIILLLSLISNNIINTYSAAFGIQLASVRLAKVPRYVWAFVVNVIYLVIALVGRDHFATILGNFLPMIGYWLSIYVIILLVENMVFRKYFLHYYTKEFPIKEEISKDDHMLFLKHLKIRYNWEIWNDFDKLTLGIAAAAAFACSVGIVAVSMSQTYWIGPIAKKLDDGDTAMWLAMAVSLVVYPPIRFFELKKFGR